MVPPKRRDVSLVLKNIRYDSARFTDGSLYTLTFFQYARKIFNVNRKRYTMAFEIGTIYVLEFKHFLRTTYVQLPRALPYC